MTKQSLSGRFGRLVVTGVIAALPAALFAQGLPNPDRAPSTSNDEGGLTTRYNSLQAENSRAEFAADDARQAASWSEAKRFASCAIGFSTDRVRGLLDEPLAGSRKVDFDDFLNRNMGCVITAGALDRDFLRGALAEGIITDPESAAPIPVGGNADKVREFIRSVKIANSGTDNPFSMAQMAAECRVGFAPIQARALLATEPGSAAEKGALTVWKSVTPQCDGFKVADKPLSGWFDRAYSAQALYHWMGFAKDGKS